MRQRTTNITKWIDGKQVKVPTILNIYKCGLCGRERHVRTKPKSKCHCRVDYPSRYMYFRYQVTGFIVWLYQQTRLLFVKEWK